MEELFPWEKAAQETQQQPNLFPWEQAAQEAGTDERYDVLNQLPEQDKAVMPSEPAQPDIGFEADDSMLDAFNPMNKLTAPELLGKGLFNALGETMELGGTIVDLAAGAVGQKTNITGAVQDNFPWQRSDNAAEQFVINTSELVPGIYAGGKLVGKALGEAVGPVKKFIGQYIGSEIGGAVTSTAEDETLIFTQAREIPGFKVNPDDSDAEANIKKTLALASDGVLLGGAASVAAGGLKNTMSYFVNLVPRAIKNWRNLDAHQKKFVSDVVAIYADLPENASKAQIQKALEKTQAALKKNSEVVISLGEANVDEIKSANDTITALINSLDPEKDAAKINQLESLRSSALSGSSPQLERALEAPRRDLDRAMSDMFDAKGGEEGIEGAKNTIVDKAKESLFPKKERNAAARAELEQAKRGIDDLIVNDPNFKQIGEQVNPDGTIQFDTGLRQTGDEIVGKTTEGIKAIEARKRELYEAIPEGVHINSQGLADSVEPILPLLDEFELTKKFSQSGDDFKRLNKFARVHLQNTIDRLNKMKRQDDALKLMEFKHRITGLLGEEMSNLSSHSDEQIRRIAEEANKYFKEEVLPMRQGVVEKIRNNNRDLPEVDRADENFKAVKQNLGSTDDQRKTEHLIDFLSKPEAGASQELVLKFGKGMVARSIQKIVNRRQGGKLLPEDVIELDNEFNKIVPILNKLAPEEKAQIEELLQTVKTRNFDVKDLQTKLDAFEKDLKDEEDVIFGNYLKDFFEKHNVKGYVALPNGSAIFKKLINDPQSEEKFRYIMDLVKDDPAAKEGIKAAWTKHAKELLTGKEDMGKLNENFLNYGKQIFEDNPGIGSLIQGLAERAGKAEKANIGRKSQGLNTREFQEAYERGTGAVITWIFGVLNPKAARIRTVTGDFSRRYNSTDMAKVAADVILSDAKVFGGIVDEFVEKGMGSLTPEQKTVMFRSLVRAGIYDERDEETFMQAEDMESNFGKDDVAEFSRNAYEQTKELFSP